MTSTPTTPAIPRLAAALALLLAGCVKAPDIILTDQRTALEQQAAGEFHALENDLTQAGIAPKGEDFSRESLEAANPDASTSTLGEVAQLYSAVQADSEWIDQLLVAGCVGEALDGLLQQTPDRCEQAVDTGQVTRVVERSNLHRRQLWRAIQQREPKDSPNHSEAQVRAVWREIHLQRVVCDAWIQKDADTWEQKKC